MKSLNWIVGAFLGLVFFTGCVTPPEVKVALEELDKGYGENIKLMNQYQELTDLIEKRNILWFEHVQKRVLLNMTLAWATTDFSSNPIEVDSSAVVLGKELVEEINRIRLPKLPARNGETGGNVFETGKDGATVDGIILTLPKIARLVGEKVSIESQSTVDLKTPFAQYRINVAALQSINAAIKNYLDIDITIAPEDVKEIASSIRSLQQ